VASIIPVVATVIIFPIIVISIIVTSIDIYTWNRNRVVITSVTTKITPVAAITSLTVITFRRNITILHGFPKVFPGIITSISAIPTIPATFDTAQVLIVQHFQFLTQLIQI